MVGEFATPGSVKYTPITRAVIARNSGSTPGTNGGSVLQPKRLNITVQSGQPEWLHTELTRVPLGCGTKRIASSFDPKFETLSARDRKLREMAGLELSSNSGDWSSGEVETDDAGSETRSNQAKGRVRSDLIASTIKWSTPNVEPARFDSEPDGSESSRPQIRRHSSDLIAATRNWSDPFFSSPVVPQLTQSGAPVRRQATDLIPATMPWVTPYSTSAMRPSVNQHRTDFRRQKGITEENFPKSGSIFDAGRDTPVLAHYGSPITSVTVATPVTASLLSTFKVKHVQADGHEEETLKALMAREGLHVIIAKAGVNIISNSFDGSVNITVRHDGDLAPQLARIAEERRLVFLPL